MAGDPRYAREKMIDAVCALATDVGAIRYRLTKAAPLVFAASEHVPDSLRSLYDELIRAMTRCTPRRHGQTRIEATVGRVRLATCESIANRIVDMAERLREYVDKTGGE
jgi:hypothetical protein